MSAPPLHPIVIWFGRLGDMIMLSALLEVLHRRYRGRCYLIGAGAWLRALYAVHSDVERVLCVRRYTAFAFDAEWWRALRALRANPDSPVYVCEFDPRKIARIRRLLALSGTDPQRCLFITREPCFAAAHWVERLVSFGRLTPAALNACDYPWPEPPPRGAPRLEVTPAARAECAAWLAAHGWDARPVVLVQPGNRRTMRGRRLRVAPADDKAWPIERWAALLHQVHAHLPGARILVCGAPRESRLLAWISDATQLAAVVAVELPLPRLLALCERAHSMISVDTGPAHAAAALSLPLVVMFGALPQSEWGPRSPSGSPVIGVGGPPQSTRLDQISVETVFGAWCALGAAADARAVPAAVADDALRSTAARATAP